MAKANRKPTLHEEDQGLDGARRAFQQGRWRDAEHILSGLLAQDPDDEEAQQLLEDTRFRAGLENQKKVRGRKRAISWRRVVTYGLLVLLVVLAGWGARRIYATEVAPQLEAARTMQHQRSLFARAQSYYEAGQYEQARATLEQLLAEAPDYEGAEELAASIETDEALLEQYNHAVALQEAGNLDEALAEFVRLTVTRPGYRDVSTRIAAIKAIQQRDELYAQAVEKEQSGDLAGALNLYEQVQRLDSTYEAETISEKLFSLHMSLGKSIATDPSSGQAELDAALSHFEEALTLRPRDAEARSWRDAATDYLHGQTYYQQGAWAEATRRLQNVYDLHPDLLGGRVVDLLYSAYVNLGDLYQAQGDTGMAYEAYSQASALPVADKALADKRIVDIVPFLTPTATPTITLTPTAPRPPGPAPAPTATATPQPLNAYHNMIVFTSDNEDSPGYWIMAPDGTQREYLGRSNALRKQYEELVEAQAYSPDGNYWLFVRDVNGIAQIFVQDPPTSQFPSPKPRQLTEAGGLCYDPAWSPDGAHIAFVSQASGSDDIHVMNPDGSGVKNLTPNKWEWDKHPSWSPDSQRIVFWSNRDLRKQIYVMDAQGRNVVNISNSEYDEYDPVWIK